MLLRLSLSTSRDCSRNLSYYAPILLILMHTGSSVEVMMITHMHKVKHTAQLQVSCHKNFTYKCRT